jgi:hypothetical protein
MSDFILHAYTPSYAPSIEPPIVALRLVARHVGVDPGAVSSESLRELDERVLLHLDTLPHRDELLLRGVVDQQHRRKRPQIEKSRDGRRVIVSEDQPAWKRVLGEQ